MTPDFGRDYFALFGIARAFSIDEGALELGYKDLQAAVHPDRFAHLPDQDKRLSMQWATRVNEAYRTLRRPLDRARYILELEGCSVDDESNTAMAPEFLMEQMEWREAVEEARGGADRDSLEHLSQRLSQSWTEALSDIAECIDDAKDYPKASEAVRRMMFLDKLRVNVEDALEELDD